MKKMVRNCKIVAGYCDAKQTAIKPHFPNFSLQYILKGLFCKLFKSCPVLTLVILCFFNS